MLNKYKVCATEVIEVTTEVCLTSEEVDSLQNMTSEEREDFIYEKINIQCGEWERGDRLEFAHIELGELL